MNKVLLIDDDIELTELLIEYLRREGLEADAVDAGEVGLHRALGGDYAAIVLDVMLPGIGGFEVLRKIRAAGGIAGQIPVLMLTARGDEIDRVLGLELGADDYLPKPFSSRELVARLRAILRRSLSQSDGSPAPTAQRFPAELKRHEVLTIGIMSLDTAARVVECDGARLELTAVEFNLLEILMRAAGDVVTREQIARDVLGRLLLPYDRSVDTHISNLRRKIGGDDSTGPIKTIRSVGYVYTHPASKS